MRNPLNLRNTIAALCIAGAGSAALAVETASFSTRTGALAMPFVKLNGGARYQNVNIRLYDLGQVVLGDKSVSSFIEFSTAENVLRLPQVTVDGVTYNQVKLINPRFDIVNVGGLVIDPGVGGRYTLEVQVTASGFAVPPITVANVPKPSTQAEFCADPDLKNVMSQTSGSAGGTWSMQSCSFNGTTGRIDMTVATPFFTMPYSATYTYR